MKLTANEEYGIRCLVRLGYAPAQGLTIPEISQAEGVSPAYAAKILRVLRKGEFVKAARGKEGGYTLARPAEKIVIGDVIDALVSLFIIVRAIQLGIARVAITRMLVNVGIEALAGSVPFVGDLFDIAFKANRRNYQILKNHISQPERQRTHDWLFLILTVGLVIASVALPLIGLIELIKHL